MLVSVLVADVRRRQDEPFLHVMRDNVAAIRLYEALGFQIRRASSISVVTRSNSE